MSYHHSLPVPIRSGWNVAALIMRGPLTDRKIDAYAKRGYYADDFRAARRELWEKKAAARSKREGNFERQDGRLIFRP